MSEWWQDAVIYQVYVRSFADASGDGIGDLAGLAGRLDYLSDLGVDALWLNPCYVSPQRDHGYDISDYFEIDPAYGSLRDLTALIDGAHRRGMRLLMDMVANHCSDQHEWFQAALAGRRGGPERARFLFRDGRGPGGSLPPNNWQSVFGGPAWARIVEPDGEPGQWYLHSFDAGQPDFDWRNPDVVEYFERVLTHWFDLGVDGFRIDVAHGLIKDVALPDWPGADDGTGGHNAAMWDRPEVHDIYRGWRHIADGYRAEPKYFVGEIWVPGVDRLANYLAPDELHQAFSFDLLVQPWDAARMRGAIERTRAQSARTGTPAAWTLNNHDVHRAVTRYGQRQELDEPSPSDMIAAARRSGEVSLSLGIRRARAAALLLLALPGTVYLYQGEELGLPEVFDLPDDSRQDPIWLRSDGAELGRDGCRVPLPWNRGVPFFGFSGPESADPWLPQPTWFGELAVDVQAGDPGSVLALYREAIARRSAVFGRGTELRWHETGSAGVLAFSRGGGTCVVNLGDEAAALPRSWQLDLVQASSQGADAGSIDPDSAVWFAGVPTDDVVPTRQRDAVIADRETAGTTDRTPVSITEEQ
ncbi:MAG TPA: alpha-amylase family glycosyl hydrolase [Lacisediminihabitans sp.]|uniref:glycoside hydrolase family 13 protein n=1 Tax=Lacisediminihabitans sp. TaxID=2787631 RepID=UPI002ED9589F